MGAFVLPFRVLNQKKCMTGDCLRNGNSQGFKKFSPHPQNSIIIPLRGSFQNFNGVPVLHIWDFKTSKNLVKLKTGHHLQSPDNCNKVPKVLYQGKNILGACKNAIWLLHCHKIIIEESYIF